jgi:hypothetical protein
MATKTPHEIATEHLPMFIAGPGETDSFFIAVVVIAILGAMLFGAFYFTLHSLPEKMAHEVSSSQLLLIGVLSLISLFTHNHYFFFAALVLASVRLPDWTTPLNSIAKAVEVQTNTASSLQEETNTAKSFEEQTDRET